MALIGTAGHVDHGKSTLVQALTGRDPDRWKEEKERGVTIDLGFAWTTLGTTEVSFVDVPGHERFMKNMLAGIEAIDVALLVVAADEGWKPQSEEHLAVLDLLGVKAAVVALTKVDRVDPELIDIAILEIEENLENTSLEGAPVVKVSALTGFGLDELRAALEARVAELPPPPEQRPRLWIDRAFTVAGAGTVVTGTLLGGSVSLDDRLTLFPGETEVRVRSIQSHEHQSHRVEPRRRVALNLGGIDRGDVRRGSMLGRPGSFVTTDRFTARVRPARYVDALTDRGAFHLHVGSGAWPVRIRMLDQETALIDVGSDLPLVVGDRFILRESGRRLVTGGGRVLDPHPPRQGRAALQVARAVAESQSPALTLLSERGRYPLQRLEAETGEVVAGATVLDGIAFDGAELTRLSSEAAERVAGYLKENPLRSGMPSARLAKGLSVTNNVLTHLVALAGLEIDGSEVRSANHAVELDEAQRSLWSDLEAALQTAGPGNLPRISDLGLEKEFLHLLIRLGRLSRVSEEFVFLPVQVEALIDQIRKFEAPFTVAEFKNSTGLSRKYAVPFLEWTDSRGLTVRSGDRRRLI